MVGSYVRRVNVDMKVGEEVEEEGEKRRGGYIVDEKKQKKQLIHIYFCQYILSSLLSFFRVKQKGKKNFENT